MSNCFAVNFPSLRNIEIIGRECDEKKGQRREKKTDEKNKDKESKTKKKEIIKNKKERNIKYFFIDINYRNYVNFILSEVPWYFEEVQCDRNFDTLIPFSVFPQNFVTTESR